MKKSIYFLFFFLLVGSINALSTYTLDFKDKTNHDFTPVVNFSNTYHGYSSTDWTAVTESELLGLFYTPIDIDYVEKITVYQANSGITPLGIDKINASLRNEGLYAINLDEAPMIIYDIFLTEDFYVFNGDGDVVANIYEIANEGGGTLYPRLALLNDDTELTNVRNSTLSGEGSDQNVTSDDFPSALTFNRILIGFYNNGAGTTEGYHYYIQNITLYNAYYGTNSLPSVNLTVDKYEDCIDGNKTTTTFTFDFDSYDVEGDTIYYSMNEIGFEDHYYYWYENFDEMTFYNDTASNNIGNFFYDIGTWFAGYLSIPVVTIMNFGPRKMLALEKGHEEIKFYFEETITNETEIRFYTQFSDDDNAYIGKLVNVFDSDILNFTINQTSSGNLTIMIRNNTYYNQAYDTATETNLNLLEVLLDINGENCVFQVLDEDDTVLVNETVSIISIGLRGLNFNSLMDYSRGDFYFLEDLYIRGMNYYIVPDFTALPLQVTRTYDVTGNFPVKFYFSDEVHIPNSYKAETINLKVVDCENYITPIADTEAEIIANVDILGLVTLFKFPLQDFLKSINVYETGKKIIWFLFVLSLITGIITHYAISKTVDIFPSLLLNSLLFLVASFVCGYIGNMIVFTIFTALCLAREVNIQKNG